MMTGEQYRQSLRDGREVYIKGQRVPDVTTEPLFATSIAMTAADYDQFYQPGEDAFGPLFFIPRSIEDLHEQEYRQLRWSNPTRTTSVSLLMLMTAASRIRGDLPEYAERISRYFEESKARDLRCVQTITDAKGDRSLPPTKQDDPDLYLRIVDRQPGGLVIRGAKMHITGAPIDHDLIVMPTKRMKTGEEDWSVACAVPVNAPGVKVIATTYAPRPDFPEDYFPYSGRHNMAEGFVIFDDVFVPHERVFLAGEVEHSATFAHSLGLWERVGSVAHYVEMADTIVGFARLIAEANGLGRIPHIRQKIAEMINYATMIRAGLAAAVSQATFTPEGWASPDELMTNAAKYFAAANWSEMVRNLHDIAGGGVLTAPMLDDLRNPETARYVEKYMRTMDGVDAEYRMRLFHGIRDFTADTFGGWQTVTVLQGGGGLHAQRLIVEKYYDMDRAKKLALRVAGVADPADQEDQDDQEGRPE
jgi:4-hydroxybutyryl-CoA dehydratase/vinylacetyl-CoA-Delta-isomerase